MGNFDCWIDGQLGEFVEHSICRFCLAFNISQTFSASAPSVLTVTGFNYDTCCDPKFGPSGNSQCPALRLIPLDIAWICIVFEMPRLGWSLQLRSMLLSKGRLCTLSQTLLSKTLQAFWVRHSCSRRNCSFRSETCAVSQSFTSSVWALGYLAQPSLQSGHFARQWYAVICTYTHMQQRVVAVYCTCDCSIQPNFAG